MTDTLPVAAGQDLRPNTLTLVDPSVAARRAGPELPEPGLTVQHLPALKALVVSKPVAGLTAETIAGLTRIVGAAAAGELPLNFIVLDFAHGSGGPAVAGAGFDELLRAVTDLILEAPVISVACARAPLGGADLELALACSMMIADDDARFDFEAEGGTPTGIYRALALKLGFVRAERLIDSGEVLDPAQMQELLLLKDVLRAEPGFGGIEDFLRRTSRRHNSCCGIYRAQRLAMPSASERLGLFG